MRSFALPWIPHDDVILPADIQGAPALGGAFDAADPLVRRSTARGLSAQSLSVTGEYARVQLNGVPFAALVSGGMTARLWRLVTAGIVLTLAMLAGVELGGVAGIIAVRKGDRLQVFVQAAIVVFGVNALVVTVLNELADDYGYRRAPSEELPELSGLPARALAERLGFHFLDTGAMYRALTLKALRAGITWVNTYHPTYSEAPWGGYKQSGIGRELGSFGLDEYTEVKQINIDLTDQPMGVYQRGKAGSPGNGHRVVPLSDRRPFREGEASKDEAWVEFCANCRP